MERVYKRNQSPHKAKLAFGVLKFIKGFERMSKDVNFLCWLCCKPPMDCKIDEISENAECQDRPLKLAGAAFSALCGVQTPAKSHGRFDVVL